MKKLSFVLIAMLVLMSIFTLVSCESFIINFGQTTTQSTSDSEGTTGTTSTEGTTSSSSSSSAGDDFEPKGDYTLGMGVSFGEFTNSQINIVVASVVLDAEGKIVLCRIDGVQNKFSINYDSEEIIFNNLRTKMEMGDDYNLKLAERLGMDNNGDGIVLEWYDQVKALESHVIGMTADEVAAMETKEIENGRVISADETLLSAGCTIQISEFKDAIVKACNDDQSVTFAAAGSFTLGVGANSDDNNSRFVDEGCDISMNIYFAASVVNADGKILASLNDASQAKVFVDWNGTVISASSGNQNGLFKTKRELKEDYNMSAFGHFMDMNGDGIVLEWYLQSAAFSQYVVGMTADQVANAPTQVHSSGYIITSDDALLNAGCTIQIIEMKAVVAESAQNAR